MLCLRLCRTPVSRTDLVTIYCSFAVALMLAAVMKVVILEPLLRRERGKRCERSSCIGDAARRHFSCER